MTVFLVEDAPLLPERLVALIASIGAVTLGHAEGAQEAIRGILATSPDAVVLDLHLKEGNGFDVLRALGKAAPGVACYVLTNYPAEGYRASAERLGERRALGRARRFPCPLSVPADTARMRGRPYWRHRCRDQRGSHENRPHDRQ